MFKRIFKNYKRKYSDHHFWTFATFSFVTFKINISCMSYFTGVMRKIGAFIWYRKLHFDGWIQKCPGHTPLSDNIFFRIITIPVSMSLSYVKSVEMKGDMTYLCNPFILEKTSLLSAYFTGLSTWKLNCGILIHFKVA